MAWDTANQTKVTWQNPQVVPDNVKQPGGFYYNPQTGYVQRWFPDNSPQGQALKTAQGQGSSPADLTKSLQDTTKKELQEQFDYLKDFVKKNPFAFDEAMAREAANTKYKEYYQETLDDFVKPLQEKITRSSEDQTRILTELVRRREFGESTKLKQITAGLETAKGGFAGKGLLSSGIGQRAVSQWDIGQKGQLQDFLAQSKANEKTSELGFQREQADYQTNIDQKNRDIFGTGRNFDTTVNKEIESQKTTALNKQKLLAEQSFLDRYGAGSLGNSNVSSVVGTLYGG